MTSDRVEFDRLTIPADVALTEIVLIQDIAGVLPPVLLMHDFRCRGVKEHGYMLRGEQTVVTDAAVWALLNGRTFDLKRREITVSPIQVLDERVSAFSVAQQWIFKLPFREENSAPGAVSLFSKVCLAQRKEQVIDTVLRAGQDLYLSQQAASTARLGQLLTLKAEVLPAGPGMAPERAIDPDVVRQEIARLDSDFASSAVREALAMLVEGSEATGVDVVSLIDSAVEHMLAVRRTLAAYRRGERVDVPEELLRPALRTSQTRPQAAMPPATVDAAAHAQEVVRRLGVRLLGNPTHDAAREALTSLADQSEANDLDVLEGIETVVKHLCALRDAAVGTKLSSQSGWPMASAKWIEERNLAVREIAAPLFATGKSGVAKEVLGMLVATGTATMQDVIPLIDDTIRVLLAVRRAGQEVATPEMPAEVLVDAFGPRAPAANDSYDHSPTP